MVAEMSSAVVASGSGRFSEDGTPVSNALCVSATGTSAVDEDSVGACGVCMDISAGRDDMCSWAC